MSFLLLLLLVLPLSEQSGLEDTFKEDPEEAIYKSGEGIEYKLEQLMQRMERMDDLEKKLETKNVEVENLQQQLKEMKVQFADIERRVEEVMLSTQKKNQNHEVARLKSEMREEVKKELNKALPTAVEQGLRDLPFEMVCAYKFEWDTEGVVNYDRVTVEFNNSDRPGGADGSMNIETGVFTTVTSGYYIITFGGIAEVGSKDYLWMWLYHNGIQLEESKVDMHLGTSGWIAGQGSRTVILHLLAGDTVDLRVEHNSVRVDRITFCVYMAPAPYGL